ncbi:pyrimidine 5'-nucleotidase [Caballeronia sordidicola]|uniref:pyrimidine 5'-nucleotidase n=1 Tax=Caballeronia sp. DA-9 TaxID=3436237 RepID=UPI001428C3F0
MSARSSRRRVTTRGAPVWLFDLDNTLHHASHEIFPAINRGMTQYIIDRLGVDIDEANRLRTGYTQRYGATLLGLVRHHPVDAADFLHVVHTFTDLASMVRAERGLARMIRRLPGRKIVLTNAPSIYARAVLSELGIGKLFERVIAIEDMQDRSGYWRAKPDAVMLRRAMRRAHVALADAVLVEDTRGHLKSYKRLGIRTVWITGHLPAVLNASGARSVQTHSGRPHYVDLKIRSLRRLNELR